MWTKCRVNFWITKQSPSTPVSGLSIEQRYSNTYKKLIYCKTDSQRPNFFRCCRPRCPACSPGHTTHIGFRHVPATLVTCAGRWSLQHYCANWRENYGLAAIRTWHWNIVRLFVVEEIFCTLSEQQIRSPPNRRLLWSHWTCAVQGAWFYHIKSIFSHRYSVGSVRLPITRPRLSKGGGFQTCTWLQMKEQPSHTQSPLDVCWNLENNYFEKRSDFFSLSYLSMRQFANWNSLRYQSVNQSILFSNVRFFQYFLKHSLSFLLAHALFLSKTCTFPVSENCLLGV
jgi:hypothetical protein